MRLSRKTEELLIELLKNEDKGKLGGYISELYKNKSHAEKTEVNQRLGDIKNSGLANVQYGDDIAYLVSLTHKAYDYIEDNRLYIKLFDKDKLIEILKTIGSSNGINKILIYDIGSCGKSQIGWRQNDEYEWQIKIEAISGMLLVKRVAGEVEKEMSKYGFEVIEINDDNSTPRFKRYIKFAHASVIPTEPIQYGQKQVFNFENFFNDFMNSCIRLQGNKRASEGNEDEKTTYIRDMLNAANYNVLDQTKRGQSATGLQAGEVDLLVCDLESIPTAIIEALVLESVDSASIKLHIDKLSGYDANGLDKNIILSYVYIADFKSFTERYKRHIGEAKFNFPLTDIEDISNKQYSEIKVISSKFNRSGLDRELFHVLLNLK
ncbi:MAG: hypothetical protein N4A47_04570 [Clostridia bacterium]|jgi:hypothetical protein|nr:hypothetical protein [Clostridia bacterium]